jgi:5-(carboxyamino)imidazole ribonucleotide synthase
MIVGILGGGQLARMLVLAGTRLGLRFRVWEPSPDAGTTEIAPTIHSAFDDAHALSNFVRNLDSCTLEFENVPASLAESIAALGVPMRPSATALSVAQDRLSEKTLFQRLGIPTPRFAPVDSIADLRAAISSIGTPGVLKTRRLGYDGKGQCVIKSASQLDEAWASLNAPASDAALIYEQFITFSRELSILGVRSSQGAGGQVRCYTLTENHHASGILRLSIAPAPRVSPELQSHAESLVQRLMSELDYVGVMALELFESADTSGGVGASLIANEIAPRVHNSGHWTIDGAATSQFENHLRAVVGLPLGDCACTGHSAMVNVIAQMPETHASCAIPFLRVHDYAKKSRAGRKVGHLNVVAPDAIELHRRLIELRNANLVGVDLSALDKVAFEPSP